VAAPKLGTKISRRGIEQKREAGRKKEKAVSFLENDSETLAQSTVVRD